jgi:Glycosyl transferases group 1
MERDSPASKHVQEMPSAEKGPYSPAGTRHGSRQRKPVDLLYVATGTTPGLQRSDRAFVTAARELGLEVVSVSSDFYLPWRVRRIVWRSMLTIDVFEAVSLAVATRRALRLYDPRAIVYATSHAAMFQFHRCRRPAAIRFDAPAQLSRTGPRFAFEHALERRRFRAARILLPLGAELDLTIGGYIPSGAAVVPLPMPIFSPFSTPTPSRAPWVVAYAASPEKKGLALIIQAWTKVDPRGHRLLVTGLDAAAARAYLATMGLDLPHDVACVGKLSPEHHRALTREAAVYLAAPRYEDYGIAQLEALADGALLVTTRSPGPYAALALAEQLDSTLVATRAEPAALSEALSTALSYSDDQRQSYQQRAAAMIVGHTAAELSRRLREVVFPALLGTAFHPD